MTQVIRKLATMPKCGALGYRALKTPPIGESTRAGSPSTPLASISHPGNEKEKHCKIDEAVANLGKLRSRLTPQKVARLAALCVVTGGQASYTRPDGIHVVSLGHLCAE